MSGLVQFVFGGTRSGKSEFAERLAAETGKKKVYLATGSAGDEEMAARIARHRVRRGNDWRTIEEPLDVVPVMQSLEVGSVVLFDCMTLWLVNLQQAGREPLAEVRVFCESLAEAGCDVVIVSNELGMGVVPSSAVGRQFRDLQGEANQLIAAVAENVFFVAAGLGLPLKGGRSD